MPQLLERLDRQALDDDSLNRVFDMVLAICRRSAYLVLLVQHPKALDRMLELFERSEWVADKVTRFPALLDELIDPALGRHIPGPEDLARGVGRILEAAQGAEAMLEGLNYLKLATSLRIAVGQLQGNLEGDGPRASLSHLAGAVLAGVLEIAGREIRARHGGFPAAAGGPADHGHHGGLAIIGYGSLGACELGYDSDLDIVFLFEADGGLPGNQPAGQPAAQPSGISGGMSDGDRPLPAERYYARLAQRVLSFLTVMTPSGRLYEVDTRLRPNGRAGSLVSSIGAFREYQMNAAWTWELQALTRARFIAGSQTVAAHFNRVRQEVLCRPRDARALAAELLEMRRRMSRGHDAGVHPDAATAPKHQPGGLVDIEFVAQLGVLCSAHGQPRVIQATGTLAQLRELEAIGWLGGGESTVLAETLYRLRCARMMHVLLQQAREQPQDTSAAATIVAARLAAGSACAATE
jgi:glutamate-ammonia-ligase adenylyltransferase